jgi:stearoyl-CoA desaturase (delta-9 desaturase)
MAIKEAHKKHSGSAARTPGAASSTVETSPLRLHTAHGVEHPPHHDTNPAPSLGEHVARHASHEPTEDELRGPQNVTSAEERSAEGHRQAEGFKAERQRRWMAGVDWGIAFWIGLLHVGACFAFFTFTWQALVLTVILGWATGGLGICLGYHRLLTHSSFRTYKPVKWFFAWLGGLAGEGSAVHWVANHRKHHAMSDHVGDPHSPVDGPWWSHMFWFMPKMVGKEYREYNSRWAPDLARDKMLVFLDRTFILWHIAMTAAVWGLGYWIGGTSMAWSFVVWGMFVRLIYVLHSTWFVNSATHLWGYRNYETSDHSTNLWWVALMTYGEGWHNNHHAYPRMARHGHKWWEIDVTFMTIRMLQAVGLAWDVVDDQHIRRSHLHTVQS